MQNRIILCLLVATLFSSPAFPQDKGAYVRDREGRVILKTTPNGNTTRIQDREGRATGKVIPTPNGGYRVQDKQGRTIYTVKPKK